MYDRDGILKDLREGVAEITFTKVNGDQRVMRCTLRSDLLPPSYKEEKDQEQTFHQQNPEVIAAWDVQKGGWRSFRVNSVEYIQLVDSY